LKQQLYTDLYSTDFWQILGCIVDSSLRWVPSMVQS